jgi:hypothetical protein
VHEDASVEGDSPRTLVFLLGLGLGLILMLLIKKRRMVQTQTQAVLIPWRMYKATRGFLV